jgi:PAS domain S-box-containing protein
MSQEPVTPSGDKEGEIVSLVRRLHELTDGRIDGAMPSDGKFDLLHSTLEKLRESEDQFRSMFTAAATGIAISTPLGRYLRANAAYCRMLGYTEEELLTRDFASLTHPEDLMLNLELRDDLLAGRRESFVMEKRYLKKNGDIVWTRHSISATRTAGGEIETLMAIAEDITERKRAEDKLRLQQAELRVLFDLMPAMLCSKDTENRFLRVNRRMAETSGKSVEQIEGKSALEVYPQEAAKYYADDLEVIRSGKPKLGIVETMRSQDGRELWVQTDKMPYSDRDGKVIGLVVMVQDITQRKQAEQELHRQRTELQALFDLMPASIWFKDTQHRVLRVNQRAAAGIGKPVAEIEGKFTHELYPKEEAAGYNADAEDVIRSGVPKLGVFKTWRNREGDERWIQKDIVPVRDGSGKTVGVIVMTQDVTESKRAEQAVRDSDERFRQEI